MNYKADCLFFKGHIPCKPHKQFGYHCDDCPAYEKVSKRILIIKLGAIGDVIRTTPLVVKYKALYPNCKITWLTWTPDILPSSQIDEILKWDHNSIMYAQNASWDIAINLDKEKEAGALLKVVDAKEKFGFVLKDNEIQPINELALHKFLTGMFDDISQANTKSYLKEIFEICGFEHQGEPYLMDTHDDKGYHWNLPKDKKIIGMNTGCGGRWTTRLWSIDKWVELVALVKLQHPDAIVLLLGGEAEDARNKEIQKRSGALYPGYYSLFEFINLVNQCHLIITQVTMGMHITLALGKKIILMNNIFNPYEFDLFNKGEIVMPDKICKCFYRGSCVDGISCMEELPALKIADAVGRHF
ncbi:MAG: glycosyltransferase family 9 protein [Bacteroidota bacterium]|nr:glycosyltransferase family 9 protein [Bacteroidota bacterium]